MRDKARLLACLLVLAAAGGCQRLNYEKEYEMGPKETRSFILTAPQYDQKVLVTISPTGGPVSAYVCKEDDQARVEQALMADKTPPPSAYFNGKISKDRAESYDFEATIPKNTPYAVVLATGNRDAKVKVKLVGR
jgi:hypothetical protein